MRKRSRRSITRRLPLKMRVKPTIPPIVVRHGEFMSFPGGDAGRTYFFPDLKLFGVNLLTVESRSRKAKQVKGSAGIYRYAVWDQKFKDFLEGSSSPIIIVKG